MALHILKWIRGWRLDKVFHSIKDKIAPVAVAITEGVKTFSESPLAETIAKILDSALGSHIAEDVLVFVRKNIFKLLAAELAITDLPNDPSDEDILEFENKVFQAIAGKDPQARSKFFTIFAAESYGIIKSYTDTEVPDLTFAQKIELIEKEYQAYLKAKAESQE